MTVLGIDPCSTKNIGYAIYDDETDSFGTFGVYVIKGTNETERLKEIWNFLNSLIDEYYVDMISVESSIGFGFAPTRANISENTGIIKLCSVLRDIPFVAINAKHAYKTTVGTLTKSDKKAKTLEYMEREYGLKCIEHTADAAILALCCSKELI